MVLAAIKMSQPDNSLPQVANLKVLLFFLLLLCSSVFDEIQASGRKPPFNGSIFGKRSQPPRPLKSEDFNNLGSTIGSKGTLPSKDQISEGDITINQLMNTIIEYGLLNQAAIDKCSELENDPQVSKRILLICFELTSLEKQREALQDSWLNYLSSSVKA